MRRVNISGEGGAVTLIAAFMLTALLGAAALAIDLGALYVEKRELQNGADAAALAIAQDCAADATSAGCTSQATALTTARTYADANARDSASTVADGGVVLDSTANKVTVTADTNDPSSADTSKLAHWFAPVLGVDATAVTAKGAAIWGPVAAGSLDTLPLAFSWCEYDKFTNLADRKSPAEAPWSSAPPPAGNGKPIIIFIHGSGEPCNNGPSGQDLPGGFGWLDTTASCEADVVDGWMGGDTGANIPTACKSGIATELLGNVIEIPVFDGFRGTGSGAEYAFHSYAAFYIVGYSFPSKSNVLIDPYTSKPFECIKTAADGTTSKCTGSDRYIMGWFTEAPPRIGGEVDLSAPDMGVHTTELVLE